MSKKTNNTKVCKFGGTSMANAETIGRVADIIKSDDTRRFVVVSAPGKRRSSDIKVTDLLYACHDALAGGGGYFDAAFEVVVKRFESIIKESGVKGVDIKAEKSDITRRVAALAKKGGKGIAEARDYLASRGEYLAAKLTAAVLGGGWEFIDAAEIIAFDQSGNFLPEKTNELCVKRLAKVIGGAVIPGFYGSVQGETPSRIKTFSRGGSDVSGAIIARAAGASVYENWTDVDGFLKADPRLVDSPKLIDVLTYKELRELSYMGANVLHPESIFPVRVSDIPINIRNTFNPDYKGTMIVPTKFFVKGCYEREKAGITGIAGRKDFVAIGVEKSMMNNELGFVRRILSVFERHGISIEHIPTGIDTVSVIVERIDEEVRESVIAGIAADCAPDNIEVIQGLALIAVVGHGMIRRTGAAADVFDVLAKAGINVRMIDQGSSELNIIIAVDNADFEKAIKALYGLVS